MSRVRELGADAWAGLALRPGRSMAAFGAIAAGTAALSLLLAVLGGLRVRIERLRAELGPDTFAMLSPDDAGPGERDVRPLTRAQAARLAAHLPGTDIASVRFGHAHTGSGALLRTVRTDPELAAVRGWRLVEGRFLDGTDAQGRDRSFVATEALAHQAGWRVGEPVALDGAVYRLAGIVRVEESDLAASDAGGRVVMGGRSLFLAHGPDGIADPVDVIFVRSAGTAGRPWDAVRRLVEQPDFGAGPIEWLTSATLTAGWRRVETAVASVAGAAVALGLLLGGAMLSGLWYMNVRERVPEIGLRRALGGEGRSVGLLFMTEALLVSAAGGWTGTLLAQAVLRWMPADGPLPLRAGGAGSLLPPLVALAAGAFFAWAPARWAARIEPADALRAE